MIRGHLPVIILMTYYQHHHLELKAIVYFLLSHLQVAVIGYVSTAKRMIFSMCNWLKPKFFNNWPAVLLHM